MNGRQIAEMNCSKENEYISKDGKCCDRCDAGSYMKAECDATKKTDCEKCGRGVYTATKNHLKSCQVCKDCSSNNNQRKVKDCTAQEDTVCECLTGFYCNNDNCDHCHPVKHCSLGEGVKVPATRTNDTICVSCLEGTYSNVTDYQSPCRSHTRCEDIGRILKTPGTSKTDAICGGLIHKIPDCHWMLPASLWSGLVLTALVLFGLIYWRKKRKSYKAASSIMPVTLIERVPMVPDGPLVLPLSTTELKEYQDICIIEGCDKPIFNPDDKAVSDSIQESMDVCPPITPLKASVSFTESTHTNGSAGHCTSSFLRTYSEPQEDEWCGT